MLREGLTYTARTVVSAANTAATAGSGDMEVFATPAMIALMEHAALSAVAASLPDGLSTVGAEISVSHIKPTPVGGEVEATAVLDAIDGRKLVFKVSARDADGLIGEGSHIRYIVDRERFMAKAAKRQG